MYFTTPHPLFFGGGGVNISPVSAFALCPHTIPNARRGKSNHHTAYFLHSYHIFYITYFPAHVTVIYNPNEIRTLYNVLITSLFLIRISIHFPACIALSGGECNVLIALIYKFYGFVDSFFLNSLRIVKYVMLD
jgi:hypothetical protein